MTETQLMTDELIISQIYYIRGQKVMLDRDLARLYEVETKQLKRQVRRNIDRCPGDFMFELAPEEYPYSRSQIDTLKQGENIICAHGLYRTGCFNVIKRIEQQAGYHGQHSNNANLHESSSNVNGNHRITFRDREN